ncbi:MAG: sulfatase-like hydrolase/transferase, partial [Phycisphaeraceae bacterium]|nr:sulfatase-like hydrolase/transferase [Phycisphaeraceae bacterium]
MSRTDHFNVIQIISDQHIADCMGVAGHAQAITPNMDRLAAQGMRFNQAYTQNPICTPSRTSILSGQYCHNHGYYGLSGPKPQSLPSFLGHFHDHGYLTAAIGKLHMPNDPTDWLLDHVDLWADSYHDAVRVDPNISVNQGEQTSSYFRYLTKLGLRDKEDSIALQDLENGNQATEARPSQLPFEHSVEGWCV